MENLPSKASGLARSAVERPVAIAALALGAATMVAILSILDRTLFAMAQTWYESNTFNHGFLILPIAAYLAWRTRAELANAEIAPEWRGSIFVVLGAAAWLVGDATGTLIIQEFSLVVIVQAVVLTIFGRSVFRILLFPLLYLYFAVPFGMELIPKLQDATAFLSVNLLKLVGVPVFSDGYLISVPGADWYVADACSGIRYVISSLALGGLFAGMMYQSWWRRALVMVVAVVVPILANGVRAFGIILLAYLTDNKLATGVDHLIYGWFFFTLVSAVVLSIGMTFRETAADGKTGRPAAPLPMVSLAPCLLATILAVLTVGAARAYGDHVDATSDKGPIHLAAPEIAGYDVATESADDHLLPVFNGADAMLETSYRTAQQLLHLRLGYYLSERRGAQAISPNHELYGAPETTIVGKGAVEAKIGEVTTAVRYQRIFWEGHGRIIWYWYWIDGRITGDPYFAKLLEAKAKLLGGQQAAAIIAVAADYSAEPKEAEAALRDFAIKSTALYPALAQAQLP